MAKSKTASITQGMNISNSDFYVEEIICPEGESESDNKSRHRYQLMIDGKPLRTPKGNIVVHHDARGLRQMATELDLIDKLDSKNPSLYRLYCTQKDFIESERPILEKKRLEEPLWAKEQLIENLLIDPVLRSVAGPEVVDQFKHWEPIENFLKEYNIFHPHLPQFPIEDFSWFSEKGKINFDNLVVLIHEKINSLSNAEYTVFITAVTNHNSLILALLIALNYINPSEFSAALMAGEAINSKVWGDVQREEERDYSIELIDSTSIMQAYIQLFNDWQNPIQGLINKGESAKLEFKSTLRRNFKIGKR